MPNETPIEAGRMETEGRGSFRPMCAKTGGASDSARNGAGVRVLGALPRVILGVLYLAPAVPRLCYGYEVEM